MKPVFLIRCLLSICLSWCALGMALPAGEPIWILSFELIQLKNQTVLPRVLAQPTMAGQLQVVGAAAREDEAASLMAAAWLCQPGVPLQVQEEQKTALLLEYKFDTKKVYPQTRLLQSYNKLSAQILRADNKSATVSFKAESRQLTQPQALMVTKAGPIHTPKETAFSFTGKAKLTPNTPHLQQGSMVQGLPTFVIIHLRPVKVPPAGKTSFTGGRLVQLELPTVALQALKQRLPEHYPFLPLEGLNALLSQGVHRRVLNFDDRVKQKWNAPQNSLQYVSGYAGKEESVAPHLAVLAGHDTGSLTLNPRPGHGWQGTLQSSFLAPERGHTLETPVGPVELPTAKGTTWLTSIFALDGHATVLLEQSVQDSPKAESVKKPTSRRNKTVSTPELESRRRLWIMIPHSR